MRTEEINKVIEQTAQTTAQATAYEFKRQNLLKNNRQTPFQKTEQLLYNYKNFEEAIKAKQTQIEDIEKMGIPEKSKSIVLYSTSSRSYETSNDKKEEKIKQIQDSIAITKRLMKIVDQALEKIKDDPYYEVIAYKYFQSKTHEEIADIYQKDISTITRNKTRLINSLKINLFSDEVIGEIFS